ncbi:MAG: hypothetical protein M0T80_14100 [Actinomycetota bacterium]|nr:hypothetical protein [Actinomycetota bacterium]
MSDDHYLDDDEIQRRVAAAIVEAVCPDCLGRLGPGPRCDRCEHPLAWCPAYERGWGVEGHGLTGRWGATGALLDVDGLAAEIASVTGLDRDVVDRVLDAELDVLGRLGGAAV